MKQHLKELEQNLLFKEHLYTKADASYKQHLVSENYAIFFSLVYQIIGRTQSDTSSNPLDTDKIQKSWSEFPAEIEKKAKLLYREISKKTHPDKDREGLYTDVFKESALAYESCNILDLYEICEGLDIPYLISSLEVEVIRLVIDTNRKTSTKILNSYIYQWIIEEDHNIKDLILNKFIKATGDKL